MKSLETTKEIKAKMNSKLDKDTGKAESQGKAELKGAEYKLVYLDDSTGSSPHKKGDTVKWSDNPKAKLISGEKVTESIINGKRYHMEITLLSVSMVKNSMLMLVILVLVFMALRKSMRL